MRFFLVLLFYVSNCLYGFERPLTAIICSYNNKDWAFRNLSSVLTQDYKNYQVVYIDDCSTDGTTLEVEKYLKSIQADYQIVEFNITAKSHRINAVKFARQISKKAHRITIVKNSSRQGSLANFYRAGHSCEDNEIILRIDGDDWLRDDQVFRVINEAYNDSGVWLTHGSLICYPSGKVGWSIPVPEKNIQANSFRKWRCPSHLLTCYAWLYKKVRLEDQLYEGEFFQAAVDQAIIFPMMEMAGNRHFFISTPLYIYNEANCININKVQTRAQNESELFIRSQPPYEKLPN